jgi:hypothetical protein
VDFHHLLLAGLTGALTEVLETCRAGP